MYPEDCECLRQPRGRVGGCALNEATNRSRIRRSLRLPLFPALLVWWVSVLGWLRRYCQRGGTGQAIFVRQKHVDGFLPEVIWGDVAWKTVRPAKGWGKAFWRKKGSCFLFWASRCINYQDSLVSGAAPLGRPCGPLPPWLTPPLK